MKQKKLEFVSGGQKVVGTLVTPDDITKKYPAVIFLHGMTSSEAGYIPIAQALAERGIVGMTLSLRGHGESGGAFDTLTVHDAVADGISAYDVLLSQNNVDPERIGIVGTSVGAAIASIVSGKRPVKSLVLRVPAIYTEAMMTMTFRGIMNQETKIFRDIPNPSETPAIQAIAKFTGSLLVITSENDGVLPESITSQYLLHASLAKQKASMTIQGATHNLTDDKWRKEFHTKVLEWFVAEL